MKYAVGALADWFEWTPGDALTFPVGHSSRTILAEVIASGEVQIWGCDDAAPERQVLVAAGSGRFTVEASTRAGLSLYLVADGCRVFVRQQARGQLVERMSFEKFTSLESQRGRATDMDRLLMLMQLNERQREQKLKEEREQLRAELEQRFAQRPAEKEAEKKEAPAEKPVDSDAEAE